MTALAFIGPLLGRRKTDPRHCVLCCVGTGTVCFMAGLVAGTMWPL